MNNLPKPILDNIYKYKHQLEFRHCMDELTDNNTDTMHLTRQALLRYLKNNINEIEWVILNNNNRMSLCDYIKELSRRIFN